MEYPEKVLTKTKKGKLEARSLIDSGKYVRYEYIDIKTGKREENKIKLVLKNSNGKIEEFFIFPLKGNKFLMVPTEVKKERYILSGKKIIKF
ncbi:MAG: hypothetical protein QXF15_01990 [Candidatus Aenigmatarchaeota archaeon]|nr:hypothetical protein [Candidatus Aenigmarchaeota archaeon]